MSMIFKHLIHPFLLLIAVALLTSCSPDIDTKSFDAQKWKDSKGACDNTRLEMMGDFDKIQDQLKGTMEPDSRNLFGRPDRIALNERMNRTHYYFLEAGPDCPNKDTLITIKVLAIEFEALGRLRMTSVRDLVVQSI